MEIKTDIAALLTKLRNAQPSKGEGIILVGRDLDKSWFIGAACAENWLMVSVDKKNKPMSDVFNKLLDLASDFLEASGAKKHQTSD